MGSNYFRFNKKAKDNFFVELNKRVCSALFTPINGLSGKTFLDGFCERYDLDKMKAEKDVSIVYEAIAKELDTISSTCDVIESERRVYNYIHNIMSLHMILAKLLSFDDKLNFRLTRAKDAFTTGPIGGVITWYRLNGIRILAKDGAEYDMRVMISAIETPDWKDEPALVTLSNLKTSVTRHKNCKIRTIIPSIEAIITEFAKD